MSDILVRKFDELDKVERKDNSLDYEVKQLIQEAKQNGYDSVKDYVKHLFQNWNEETDIAIINELYDEYMKCLQMGTERLFGEGKWDENTSFEEFLRESLIMLEHRLEEIKWKKQTKFPSYPGLVELLPDIKDVPSGVGEPLSIEDYDFYEMLIKKTMEAIKSVLTNESKLNKYLQGG